jgi:2-C-methyl-D-erythritol 4-phosphate cytidylyltransferase
MVYALIVAGGRGSRFKSPISKQYTPLAGVPILIRTLSVFEACNEIDSMVVVVPAEDVGYVRDELLADAGLRKPVQVCSGGLNRQDSVFNGLKWIAEDDSVVVIHDAVRPLVTCECIRACVEEAERGGAAIAAVPAWDTLKRVTDSGTVEATLPRDRIWLAQTPQAFRTGLIRAAHHAAQAKDVQATDDAALLECEGGVVRIIAGSHRNIKITTIEDISLAEAFLGLKGADCFSVPGRKE